MSQRFISILVKTVGFLVLSAVTVTTVYGYRFDPVGGSISQQGILDITRSSSEMTLFVDGEEIKSTKLHIIQSLPVGKHTIGLKREGYRSFEIISNFENQNANQFGTIYLIPDRTHLQISGETSAIQELNTVKKKEVPQESCTLDLQTTLNGHTICRSGSVLTIDNHVVENDMQSISILHSGLLLGSNHELAYYDLEKNNKQVIYRTQESIASVTQGPTEQNLFIATKNNVQFCDRVNLFCTNTLDTPSDIEKISFDQPSNMLSVQMKGNQIMQVQIPFDRIYPWSNLM